MSDDDLDPKWDLASRPTERQRRFTTVLAALLTIALAFLAILAIWGHIESVLPVGFPVVISLATVVCGVIFWRSLSSRPRSLSHRAVKILSMFFIVIGAALLVAAAAIEQAIQGSLFTTALGFSALSAGIVNLVRANKKGGGTAD